MTVDAPQTLRTVVVVLAGGVGVRAGLGMPKQLARIAGKPIIEHTIAAIDSSPDVDEIIVMMEPHHMEPVRKLIADGSYPKLTNVYEGGTTRNDTTQLALEKLGDEELKVLFHDAVRPFVSHQILRDCIDALDEYGAVDTAIPSADTIIEVREENVIVDVPPRSKLRRGQTPQGFRLSTIRRAYEKASADPGFTATDDCTVVLRYAPNVPIAVVPGSDENMKITEAIDVFIADKLFQLKTADPAGYSAEAREEALEAKTLVVFGGSDGIGRGISEAAERYGAVVFPFSRSTTGTHIQERDDVVAALKLAFEATGRIDYVVNAAGVLEMGNLEDFSHEAVRNTIDINLMGPIIIAQESLPYLKESKGQLLFFTSSSYTRGRANYGMYSATKAATVNLTQSLAEEWADYGIRVNCINPERTKTTMRLQAFGEEPEGTLLSAEQVALASIDTLISGTTGQIVDVRRRTS
ncbi:MAG: family NAD(P)-dependent oxidoreductase [Naasia sp.]|jgi:2-C-methyl-D-erythritol 4-phosphate cytidylyltransferase|uniref:bifunctional cytidylyltransferase/SDR family oxidoreductase n=1 Tax=Naasia sp. TaxID=2546198 RepID=UPI002622EA44|nr:bifunctional cytidylyltransferase/SDR family oxidoreductase [Naasia sp.]MCU1569968.1 family NAD(P)-dependent oxidoreductase [Naasia sp.]